jgi:hypothetical protein
MKKNICICGREPSVCKGTCEGMISTYPKKEEITTCNFCGKPGSVLGPCGCDLSRGSDIGDMWKGSEDIGKAHHPKYYNEHPSGIEAIDVVEHMGFNLGNSMKYLWRADLKSDAKSDMKKAVWYTMREMYRRKMIEKELMENILKEFESV